LKYAFYTVKSLISFNEKGEGFIRGFAFALSSLLKLEKAVIVFRQVLQIPEMDK
jgi:hypothetical protein